MTEAQPFYRNPIKISLAALAVVLAGCASTTQWVNTTRPGAQLSVDMEFCRVEGEGKLPRPDVSHPSVELTGLAALITIFERKSAERQYQADLNAYINECLRTKGWKPQ
ncbi:hypothetical protein AOB54_03860 [beta proteobacterium MWH-UniP1]